jgi:hypothetical protein
MEVHEVDHRGASGHVTEVKSTTDWMGWGSDPAIHEPLIFADLHGSQ